MKVVSNAGPLIARGQLGQLGLLLKLYSEILIPREVYNEVVANGLRLGALDAQAVSVGLAVPANLAAQLSRASF